ncbi:MAG: tryptophan 7-halogenase [Verrucomicrobia subdivision 3 bacterium]|nr:tryptophan 7-halogenase [Limisphaerales bacterium]
MAGHDVIIIGAGPAGSAAAAILAEHGRRVLVLEREKFPRYHIGESLLPFTYQPLERLGMIEKLKQSAFTKKYSVQFVSPDGRASQPFYFFDRYDRETVAQTWQVMRAEFDEMLLNNAREKGAEVIEEISVKELIWEGKQVVGVRAVDQAGEEKEFRAPLTFDATGKEALTANRNGWRERDPFLNKIAVWTYYKGAVRQKGIDEGATGVAFVPQKGWFWWIPLHDDRASVGVVAEGKYLSRDGVRDPKAMLEREIENNQWVKDNLAPATQIGEYYITNEFTHHSRHCGTHGLLLLGDAFCFLDPVFSSGLMLALKSGVMAADAAHEALEANDLSPERFTEYATDLREGIENMRKLCYAFYNENFSFGKLVKKYPEVAGDVTDCLSGDVNKDFSHMFKCIEDFCEVPEALDLGEPLK